MKRLRNEEGMITVEVSVLLPMLAAVSAGVVFFFLFFLDMSAAKGEAIRIADEVAAAWKTNGSPVTGEYEPSTLLNRDIAFLVKSERRELAGQAENRLRNRLKERLSISKPGQIQVQIKSFRVHVQVHLSFGFPLGIIENMMGKGLTFSCETTAFVDNWEEWLRAREGLRWK